MLSNSEVKAIANRLKKKLDEQNRMEKERIIYEYIPSPLYMKTKSLLDEYNDLGNQVRELEIKRSDIFRSIESICKDLGYSFFTTDILDKIIENEISIPEVPSLAEIKDDIIISAMDSDFNVEEYINNQLNNYK